MNGVADQMQVDDFQGVEDALAQEIGHRRLARLGKAHEKAQRREVARELVVVEQDPAQDFAPLVIALWPRICASVSAR